MAGSLSGVMKGDMLVVEVPQKAADVAGMVKSFSLPPSDGISRLVFDLSSLKPGKIPEPKAVVDYLWDSVVVPNSCPVGLVLPEKCIQTFERYVSGISFPKEAVMIYGQTQFNVVVSNLRHKQAAR